MGASPILTRTKIIGVLADRGIGKTGRGGGAGGGDFLVKPGPGTGKSRAQYYRQLLFLH